MDVTARPNRPQGMEKHETCPFPRRPRRSRRPKSLRDGIVAEARSASLEHVRCFGGDAQRLQRVYDASGTATCEVAPRLVLRRKLSIGCQLVNGFGDRR